MLCSPPSRPSAASRVSIRGSRGSARDLEDLEPGRAGELLPLLVGGAVEIGLQDQAAVVEDLLAVAVDEQAADRGPAGARLGLGARPAVPAVAAHHPDPE